MGRDEMQAKLSLCSDIIPQLEKNIAENMTLIKEREELKDERVRLEEKRRVLDEQARIDLEARKKEMEPIL